MAKNEWENDDSYLVKCKNNDFKILRTTMDMSTIHSKNLRKTKIYITHYLKPNSIYMCIFPQASWKSPEIACIREGIISKSILAPLNINNLEYLLVDINFRKKKQLIVYCYNLHKYFSEDFFTARSKEMDSLSSRYENFLRWVTGKKNFILKRLFIFLFIKLKDNFFKIPRKVKKLFFFPNFHAESAKKMKKQYIFLNINISWTNACFLLIFWWNATL